MVLFVLGGAAVAQADEAKRVYEQLCASCHGADLSGGKGPSLLGDLKLGDDASSLAHAIKAGFPNTGMPPAGSQLGDADIAALVVYLTERRINQIEPGPAAPLDQQLVRESEKSKYRIEAIINEGLQIPWSFDWLPDGRLLLTERIGRLRVIQDGKLLPDPVADIPAVIERGEGGLMAVAVSPTYAQDGWIYLSFSDPGEGEHAMTKIVRGKLRDHRFTDQETIFAIPKEQYQEGYVLFGSRLQFDRGYLFFTIGERGQTGDAQKLEVPNGKVHRVWPDGRTPSDNPFADTPGAWGSIWSYGHRNPQGLAINPTTHEVWESEHGPRGGDEVNFIRAGKNYGWPVITYGMNYEGTPVSDRTAAPGMEQPARYWTPSIAVSPIAFYTGDKFPGWKNNLFVGSLAQQKFIRFEVDGGKLVHQEELFSKLGRVRDIKTGPDGYLYVAFEELHGASGWLVRIVPAN
ncbi:MAG: PQQ-dependent sugar dehydrogenase [Lacunisphaera sp.]